MYVESEELIGFDVKPIEFFYFCFVSNVDQISVDKPQKMRLIKLQFIFKANNLSMHLYFLQGAINLIN